MARSIQITKRKVPIEQIIAIKGNNPMATGISNVGATLGQVLARKAELQRQGQQLAALSQFSGQEIPPELLNSGVTPEQFNQALAMRDASASKKSNAAKDRVGLELQLEKLRTGTVEIDPLTGKRTEIPGVQGLSLVYDEEGNPSISRNLPPPTDGVQPPDQPYKPALNYKTKGGGASQRGSAQQSNFADSADSVPLIFVRDAQTYVRPDGSPVIGKVVPLKGNAEAVTSSSRASVLFPKVDPFFKELDDMGEVQARLALTPGSRSILFPKLNQVRNELRQIGFTFGGKAYTGTEADIIEGAMIPSNLDSKDARENKRIALKGYMSGQMDLLGVANLLGPAGQQIKQVLGSSALPTLSGPRQRTIVPPNALTATNPNTGETVYSSDGGQSWQPVR